VNEPWQSELIIARTQIFTRSLKHFAQRDLLPGNFSEIELAEKIFHAPFVLVSHGTEADPILNYGNKTALALWEMSWDELTRTPSRLTAAAPNRAARARLLETVSMLGFIDDYCGVRIFKMGRRFKISRATVWNLISENGQSCGQAARFSQWEFL
jgi:MEKHLA domain